MRIVFFVACWVCFVRPAISQTTGNDSIFIAPPYLQIGYHPSPTTLDLLWHAKDVDDNWSVEISKSKGNWDKMNKPVPTRITTANLPEHFVYRAALAGLTPGETFSYRVLKGTDVVFTADAKAPKTADQSYRFIASGDIGAATTDAKKLAYQAWLAKPDLVVVPGDIVYENGLISEYRTKFWPVYNANEANAQGAPLMRSIPFVAAPGNHDADTRDLNKFPDALAYYMLWDQPLNGPVGKEGGPLVPVLTADAERRKSFEAAAGEAYLRMSNFSFDYGNAHWLVLDADNYVDWTDSSLVKWVADDLTASGNATWHFVVFHHPGFNSSREHFEQQQMRLLSPVFESGKVDIVFNGHVHNYQRSFPMQFVPDKKGTQLVGGKDGKTLRGRVVNGRWTLDKTFDGKKRTNPKGVIYLVTGAGGQELYNPEQQDDPDSWQKFTYKFISSVHSLTVADVNGKKLTVRQIAVDGKEIDLFTINKQ